jgi:N-6 DNA Methylase
VTEKENAVGAARRAHDTAIDFLQATGRLPALDDPVPPWDYRAWLLPYVAGLHDSGLCGNRWGYLTSTLAAGCLLPDPIPLVRFGEPDGAVEGLLDRWTRIVGWDMGGWHDFARLIDWLAWGLGVGPKFDGLKPETCRVLYEQMDLTPLLATPYDYLGTWIATRKAGGWNPSGFFPTPHAVVECMVELCFHDVRNDLPRSGPKMDPRCATTCDPCVGTGRMLLHAANHTLRLYGQDIDYLVLAVCRINLAMYAPWGVFPLPDSFFANRRPDGADQNWLTRPGHVLVADYVLRKWLVDQR